MAVRIAAVWFTPMPVAAGSSVPATATAVVPRPPATTRGVPPACDVAAWRTALTAHLRAWPQAGGLDLYKFAHQGIMGSEHAVSDTASVRAWMDQEVAGLSAHPEPGPQHAPLVEPLPPDGQVVRVHLRPFLARGGRPDALLHAFVATANTVRGDTAQFACADAALAGMPPSTAIHEARALIVERRRAGFPASHHSDAFEQAYAPAYRVVHHTWVTSLLSRLTP